jgi:hypothetical protein
LKPCRNAHQASPPSEDRCSGSAEQVSWLADCRPTAPSQLPKEPVAFMMPSGLAAHSCGGSAGFDRLPWRRPSSNLQEPAPQGQRRRRVRSSARRPRRPGAGNPGWHCGCQWRSPPKDRSGRIALPALFPKTARYRPGETGSRNRRTVTESPPATAKAQVGPRTITPTVSPPSLS